MLLFCRFSVVIRSSDSLLPELAWLKRRFVYGQAYSNAKKQTVETVCFLYMIFVA